jgi:hypothetical protein
MAGGGLANGGGPIRTRHEGARRKKATLPGKCTEGTLRPAERAEDKAYVTAIEFLTVLQAKARGALSQAAGT